jgi:hypothetical protein
MRTAASRYLIQGTLANTAAVSSVSPDDPVPGNNSSTLPVPVVP